MTDKNSKDNDDLETRTAHGSSGDKQPLPTIDRIDSFRIDKTISSGASGTVFLAYDESMKRQVALKILHPSLSITSSAQKRFAREAWIAGQLEHANIIKVYSRGEDKQLHYIAMEYAEGGSLSDYIKILRETASASNDISATANRERIKFIVNKFIELVGALEHIHSKGFIHRDIKPHNILLSGESKQFKLTDFGIAHAEDMTRMTKAGDFMGTIHYMSPEQISAHRTKVDKRTDIYSLGVTLYEALTLSLPFEGDSEEKLIGEIIAGHYIPARKRNKTIPRDLETVLIKATHHDPQRRYQSAVDFAEDLRRFLADRPISAKRDNIFYRARKSISFRKKGVLTGFAIMVVALSAGIINEQRLETAYDNEKILNSLQRAVETKTSPFEFESDWERLSHILFDHVKSGEIDSIMIWFLKTTAIPDFYHRNYSLFENAMIWPRFKRIQLFNKILISKMPNLINNSIIDYLVERKGSTKSIHCFYKYGTHNVSYIPGSGVLSFNELRDTSQSLRNVPFRVITNYYLDGHLYTNGTKIKEIRNTGIVTDSILKGLFKPDGAVGTARPEWYCILDTNRLEVARPVFSDTTIDTASTWLFREWPEDFPQEINPGTLADSIYRGFAIKDLVIVRKENDSGLVMYEMNISAQISEYVPSKPIVPIAGELSLQINNFENTILIGHITREHALTLRLFFNDEEARNLRSRKFDSVDDWPYISQLRVIRNQSEGPLSWWFTSENIDATQEEFTLLVNNKSTSGALIITPSIDAARTSGIIEHFWGDTLIFNITFQAIDSTNIN